MGASAPLFLYGKLARFAVFSSSSMNHILAQLATEIQIRPDQVKAAVDLLDGGATVPFIARYRKEATGGLDDVQLRELEYRLGYLRELQERREAVIKSIQEQGKLTPELLAALQAAATKQELEDLYLPYKPKRRTKGMIAREAGLEPLADALLDNPALNPEEEAAKYLRPAFTTDNGDNPGVADAKAALDGARQILMERFSEDATLIGGFVAENNNVVHDASYKTSLVTLYRKLTK